MYCIRIANVKARGIDNALMVSIAAARGEFVDMGDAGDSYDSREIPRFVEKLRDEYDFVEGCRLLAGAER